MPPYKNFKICVGDDEYSTLYTNDELFTIKSDILETLEDYITFTYDEDGQKIMISVRNTLNSSVNVAIDGEITDSDGGSIQIQQTETIGANTTTEIDLEMTTGHQISSANITLEFYCDGYTSYIGSVVI